MNDIPEAERADAYAYAMEAGMFVLAALPDFQYAWMVRDTKERVTDPAILAVLNEDPFAWSLGHKPTRLRPLLIADRKAQDASAAVDADNALRALLALGYKQRAAKRALEGVTGTAEDQVRVALAKLTTPTQHPVELKPAPTAPRPRPVTIPFDPPAAPSHAPATVPEDAPEQPCGCWWG